MIAIDWIRKDHLPALLSALSHICHHAFNDADTAAVSYGLTDTSLENDCWFDYSLAGEQTIALQFCTDDDDSDIICCRIHCADDHRQAIEMMQFFLENFALQYLH
ncbi:hypothetical protein HGH92_23255 [Chitinophaga varians]|uniref:Uncharacterized protein n=1 Tax=Chitinophaga varians TaxID=2202339 RepID=A0A847RW02_9BACT|nr:hypothetical protein [Chitinophaga varians]NLR67243.1 hypothetical protein [Chitinophaga varians]